MDQPLLRNRSSRPVQLDVEPMGAMQQSELMDHNYKPDGERGGSWLTYIAGKHGQQTRRVVVFNFFMETVACFFIALSVGLGAWLAYTTNRVINMIIIAVLYAISWRVATRLPADYALRRHCNGALTTAYLFTGDIGIPGWIYYLLAQVLGSLFGGLTLMALLKNLTAQTIPIVQSTVPIPLTTNTSFATVFCLEVFGAAIIAFVQLTAEFLNTKGNYQEKGEDNRKKLYKNYQHATMLTTFVILWLVLICYNFDVFTFNNVAYMGGLFAGINPRQVGGILPDTVRDIRNLANLNNALLYPNSVFIGRTAAWALYFFGPILGGLVGGLLFMILFWIGAVGPAVGTYRTSMFPNAFMKNKVATSVVVGNGVDEDESIAYQRMPPPEQKQSNGRLPTGLFPTKQ